MIVNSYVGFFCGNPYCPYLRQFRDPLGGWEAGVGGDGVAEHAEDLSSSVLQAY